MEDHLLKEVEISVERNSLLDSFSEQTIKKGNLLKGKQRVDQQAHSIEESPSGSDNFCKVLVNDLTEASNKMVDRYSFLLTCPLIVLSFPIFTLPFSISSSVAHSNLLGKR